MCEKYKFVRKKQVWEGLHNLVGVIQKLNPNRDMNNLPRRVIKLSEETGEASEAFLYAPISNNRKNITWDDFREEAIDAAIIGIDLALTKLPIDEDKTPEEIHQEVMDVFEKKLNKWEVQLANGEDATQR